MRRKSYAPCLAVALVVAACASPAVKKSPEQRYLHALEDATAVYESTRQAVHKAYTAGQITEEQNERIAVVGRRAEVALRAATTSLQAWLALGGSVDTDDVEADLTALQLAVTDLLDAWRATR